MAVNISLKVAGSEVAIKMAPPIQRKKPTRMESTLKIIICFPNQPLADIQELGEKRPFCH